MQKREVSTVERHLRAYLLSGVAILLVESCVPPPPAITSPSALQNHHADTATTAAKDTVTVVDFGEVFETPDTSSPHDTASLPPAIPQIQNAPVTSLRFPSFTVKNDDVRIALRQNATRVVAYSAGSVTLRHSRAGQHPQSFRGRLLFEAKSGSGGAVVTVGRNVFSVAVPCTLLSDNPYNFIELGDSTYRGTIIVTAGRSGTFTVINLLNVEEYLRGVVPLEMGNRSHEEIEALKAQAVAARTYTYRRMAERITDGFDLFSTTADQVYGGASVETRESDLAVASTADLIMVDGDSIIIAYYHSTCGGITADVFEAWGKPARHYLRSVSDADPSGRAWCRASAYFDWDETWSRKQFSAIVTGSLRAAFPDRAFGGDVVNLTIDGRFSCGRVRQATIAGSGWTQEVGGDQIRFVLRRGVGGKPILRSSNFRSVVFNEAMVKITGKGYGHGVGMCQMGAVGRAQAGQNFVTILKAYYSGVSIVTATIDNGTNDGR